MSDQFCKICNSNKLDIVYDGPIRAGTNGKTAEGYRIFECIYCRSQFLTPMPEDALIAYQDGTYREEYDGAKNIEEFRSKHDKDQAIKLSLVGLENIRGRAVGDVGCGAGCFLDLINGIASRTVAVEPMTEYKKYLQITADAHYFSTNQLAEFESGKLDLIFGFAVIEHIHDPVAFLKSLKSVLNKSGKICLTTPNRKEILMETNGKKFFKHFYRTAHCWYFDIESLKFLARHVGLKITTTRTFHTYDISNYLIWLRDGEAPGHRTLLDEFSHELNATWRAFLESKNLADQIYVELECA